MPSFPPGSLVRCRDREWVVLPADTPDLLLLRPLGGAESEITGIALPLSQTLGIDAVEPATFPPPDPTLAGDFVSGSLLRLLIETADRAVPQLAEELIVAGFEGRPGSLTWLDEARALGLLETAPSAGNLSQAETIEVLRQALEWLPQIEQEMNAIANARAVALLESHRRVRQATHTGRVTIRPQLPLDVLGLFVLLPVPKGIVTKL